MTRAFHLLVSLLVALSLGTAGLCCCLLAQPDGAQGTIAAESARSCCSSEPAPVQPDGACPIDQDEEDCDCPDRETALVAGSGIPTADSSASPGDAVTPLTEDMAVQPADASSRRTRVPHPPPKKPLYRTLSVLLC